MKTNKSLQKKLKRRALKFLRAAWPLDLRNSLDAPNVAGSDEFKGALQAIVTLVSKLEGNVQ